MSDFFNGRGDKFRAVEDLTVLNSFGKVFFGGFEDIFDFADSLEGICVACKVNYERNASITVEFSYVSVRLLPDFNTSDIF